MSSDREDGEITEELSSNNNAMAAIDCSYQPRTGRSPGVSQPKTSGALPAYLEEEPSTSTGNQTECHQPPSEMNTDLALKVSAMQDFMLKKGLITDEELQEILSVDGLPKEPPLKSKEPATTGKATKKAAQKNDKRKLISTKDLASVTSSSDITIYKRAVDK